MAFSLKFLGILVITCAVQGKRSDVIASCKNESAEEECLAFPTNCTSTEEPCVAALLLMRNEISHVYTFNMTAPINFDYVTLGFSLDLLMDFTLAVDCINNNGTTYLRPGYNSNGYQHIIVFNDSEIPLEKNEIRYDEEGLFCSFQFSTELFVDKYSILQNISYYLFLAAGILDDRRRDIALDFHWDNKLISNTTYTYDFGLEPPPPPPPAPTPKNSFGLRSPSKLTLSISFLLTTFLCNRLLQLTRNDPNLYLATTH